MQHGWWNDPWTYLCTLPGKKIMKTHGKQPSWQGANHGFKIVISAYVQIYEVLWPKKKQSLVRKNDSVPLPETNWRLHRTRKTLFQKQDRLERRRDAQQRIKELPSWELTYPLEKQYWKWLGYLSSQEGTTLPHVLETCRKTTWWDLHLITWLKTPPTQDAIVANEGVNFSIPGGLKIEILVV